MKHRALPKQFAVATLLLVTACLPPGILGPLSNAIKTGTTPTPTASKAPVSLSPPSSSSSGSHERLWVGTGEYDEDADWHAILRFDEAEGLDSSGGMRYRPLDTSVVTSMVDRNDIALNFAHTLFYDDDRDELWIGSMFTQESGATCDPSDATCAAGSVAVITNASTMSATNSVDRHIFGSGEFNKPHGIWLDRSKDILYVANTFAGNILVYDSAHSLDGPVSADRVIETGPTVPLGAPVHLTVDEDNNRLFVASMTAHTGAPSSILVFNEASTLSGPQDPDVRISRGELEVGNNWTTHNVIYDKDHEKLYVAHHTNKIIQYDLAGEDLGPADETRSITPDSVTIQIEDSGTSGADWSAYGIFYLASQDRLYVSAGYTPGGSHADEAFGSGPNMGGSPRNAVKIYDNISSTAGGLVTPARIIYWNNGDQYYPPQPLWVDEY